MKLILLLIVGTFAQTHKAQTFDSIIDAKDYTSGDSDQIITKAILEH